MAGIYSVLYSVRDNVGNIFEQVRNIEIIKTSKEIIDFTNGYNMSGIPVSSIDVNYKTDKAYTPIIAFK